MPNAASAAAVATAHPPGPAVAARPATPTTTGAAHPTTIAAAAFAATATATATAADPHATPGPGAGWAVVALLRQLGPDHPDRHPGAWAAPPATCYGHDTHGAVLLKFATDPTPRPVNPGSVTLTNTPTGPANPPQSAAQPRNPPAGTRHHPPPPNDHHKPTQPQPPPGKRGMYQHHNGNPKQITVCQRGKKRFSGEALLLCVITILGHCLAHLLVSFSIVDYSLSAGETAFRVTYNRV